MFTVYEYIIQLYILYIFLHSTVCVDYFRCSDLCSSTLICHSVLVNCSGSCMVMDLQLRAWQFLVTLCWLIVPDPAWSWIYSYELGSSWSLCAGCLVDFVPLSFEPCPVL